MTILMHSRCAFADTEQTQIAGQLCSIGEPRISPLAPWISIARSATRPAISEQ